MSASPRSSSRSGPARPCSRPRRATSGSLGSREFGVDHGINYSQRRTGSIRCAASPVGRGVDLVVDSVGGQDPRRQRRVPRVPGRVHHGRQRGPGTAPLDISSLAMGNRSLTGVFLGAEIATERAHAMIARHIDDVVAGRLHVVDRSHLSAVRSGGRARVHREPPGVRAGSCSFPENVRFPRRERRGPGGVRNDTTWIRPVTRSSSSTPERAMSTRSRSLVERYRRAGVTSRVRDRGR